jgi:hypothetical protein
MRASGRHGRGHCDVTVPRAALRCPLKSDPRPALQLVAVIWFNAVAADITRIVAAAVTRLTQLRAQR